MYKFFQYTSLLVFLGYFLIVGNFGSKAWGQTIHVILAADGADGKIGTAVKADQENMKNLFQGNVPAANLNLVTLDADSMTPDGMLQSVDGLTVAPHDTVIFYYSGHGAFDTDDKRQFLALTKGGNLYRETLLTKMEGKNPRLTVLLTDCCNNQVNNVPGTRSFGIAATPPRSPENFSPLFENLFVFCKGTVDLTSSKPGEFSFVIDIKDGSIFTKALIEVVNHNKTNSDMYWSVFYERLGDRSQAIFREKFPIGVKIPDTLKGPGIPDVQTAQTVYEYRLPVEGNSLTPVLEPVREGPRLGLRAVNHEGKGVRITGIAPNSPASKAGIVVGEIVTAINGKEIGNEISYSDAVDASPKMMTLTLQKTDGTSRTVSVEMGW